MIGWGGLATALVNPVINAILGVENTWVEELLAVEVGYHRKSQRYTRV